MYAKLALGSYRNDQPFFSTHSYYLRAGSLYSTVDVSRQDVFWLVGEKKIINKICLPANVGGRKKIKGKFSEFYLFLGYV